MVRGAYSMDCYVAILDAAFRDHCLRREEDPRTVLESTDLFSLHAPFRNMPFMAMKKLLADHMGLDDAQAQRFLEERSLDAAVYPVSRVGNIYSGSLYLSLAFLLADRYRALGAQIVGRRLLLASYGSGSTMIVLSGRVAPGAPEVLARWNLEAVLETGVDADPERYERWLAAPYSADDYAALVAASRIRPGRFHLAGIRKDGYREYRAG